MFHVVRLATVHPLLAHFTIGGLPLVVIAYAMAARRRSPAWTRIGDAALGVTATLTLGTGLFGLVSNAVVPWPGGIEKWRWLHLGFGVATTASLVALAVVRWWRRGEHATGLPTLAAALTVAAIAGATGWIGGEVLVFHSGMAVRAAGDGALAPTVSDTASPPRDFLDAMRGARASWAGVQTRLASMLVQHPRDEDFERIAIDGKRLHELATAMADFAGKPPGADDALVSMSETLAGDGQDIADAAHKKSLQDIAHAVGEASSHCADCHEQMRWKSPKR
jgi:uncharacterized membrane protein